jgi:hypothetical protein
MTWGKTTETRENAQRLTRMGMEKEENCTNFEGDKSAKEVELCDYDGT